MVVCFGYDDSSVLMLGLRTESEEDSTDTESG